MAEPLESFDTSRCVCCLSKSNEKRLQVHNIQIQSLRNVLQMEQLVLCYICKRVAEKTEKFLKNIEVSQSLFYHFMHPPSEEKDATKLNPVINLTLLPLISDSVIELSGKDSETEQNSSGVWVDVVIKLEPEQNEEQTTQWSGDWDPKHNEKEKSSSDSEVAYWSEDNDLCSVKINQIGMLKDVNFEKVILNREQCMAERQQKAMTDKYRNSMYKCEHCIKQFCFKDTYEEHMEIHKESMGNFECDICKRRMPSAVQLTAHYKYHTERFKCCKCEFVAISKMAVKEHYLIAHCNDNNYAYTCSHCGKQYKHRLSLRKHVTSKHKPKRREFPCQHCDKVYYIRTSLQKHIVLKHTIKEGDKSFVCTDCGRMCPSQLLLEQHKMSHIASDKRNHYCAECNKSFKSNKLLKAHFKTASHSGGITYNMKCPHCEKRCRVQRDMTRHINSVHLNIRPVKCEQCEKTFFNNYDMKIHKKKVHDGYRCPHPLRLICSVCSKVFNSQRILESHMRTHTGERPYHCAQCPAQFAHTGSLHNHVKLVHLKLTRDGKPKGSKKNA